jgi:hypothetical protein
MTGGTISGNKISTVSNNSLCGGGVGVYGGTFNMTGGTISGNAVGQWSSFSFTIGGYGGGVYVNASSGKFTKTGGIITGSNADRNPVIDIDNMGNSKDITAEQPFDPTLWRNLASEGNAVYVYVDPSYKKRDDTANVGDKLDSDKDKAGGGGWD